MHVKSLDQMSDDELNELLDSEGITPAIAKKIESVLQRRSHPEPNHPREEEVEDERE